MKALIVEDSEIYQAVIRDAFEKVGIEAHVVSCSDEGMEYLATERVDFLCLDMHLPDMNGLEFARRFRARAANRLLPIILLTGDDSPYLTQEAMNAGVTEVFLKSKMEELHDSLSEYIKRTSTALQGKVLLVEDSPTTEALLSYMLKKLQLKVDSYDNGEDALAAFRAHDYDLVVSDVILAGKITGLGLVREIRNTHGEKCRIPVLGLSSLDDDARKIEMLLLGASDYVTKPVIEEEFLARVGNLIQNKQLVDQVQEQRQMLRKVSITDQLTGLYNRHYLEEVTHQMISNAHRKKEPISLMVLDLDHFKKINDNHGHEAGDVVLSEFGKLLKQEIREGDVAARFGGEEFVVLLNNCDLANCKKLAERLQGKVRALNPSGIPISVSIGLSSQASDVKSNFSDMFQRADSAVYRAKREGRDCIVLDQQSTASAES